jgi:uncharacterized membrane protein YeiH
MKLIYLLEILGTVAFAASGSLTAISKRMDPFGIFIIAFVTSLGGGTLRDILLGKTPVAWMSNLDLVYIIILTVILSILFRKRINYLRKSLFLFDTIGLGIFTIGGVEIGIQADLHPIISIILGTLSGSFGGVIRDILCNEIPIIFRREIYATACIIGGIVFIGLSQISIPPTIIYTATIAIIILVRIAAVRFQLTLPTFYKSDQNFEN